VTSESGPAPPGNRLGDGDAERARLADQLLSAEQAERRRLADYLHDTSVQSLSGIALMLDAALGSLDARRNDDARTVVQSALSRLRATIGSLRDLSFELEPVVLRDQGFTPAVEALAEKLGIEQELAIDVDVAAAETLGSNAQAALYQIIREALHGAIRRGPPSRIAVHVRHTDGGIQTTIEDDGPDERRRSLLDAIGERARTLGGTMDVSRADQGGVRLRVTVPAYAARA
jgi:two-component system, NarL family, sensor kinase